MYNPIPAQHRFAIKLIAIGFCVGSAFQLGVSVMSQISPRAEVIEIRQTTAAPQGAEQQRYSY